jgi:hypothetical protein
MQGQEIYKVARVHPKCGHIVQGCFVWVAEDGDSADFEPLYCQPSPTELWPSYPSPPEAKERTYNAVGLTVEPSAEQIAEWTTTGNAVRSLRDVCNRYYHGCVCGTSYPNNCAHYLSNAFILAGYSALLSSPIITARCPHGRPIRALDMLRWFQSVQVGFNGSRVQRNTGIWATYQEKPSWSHVVVIDTDAWVHYGTGDYWDWPVQWNYRIR